MRSPEELRIDEEMGYKSRRKRRISGIDQGKDAGFTKGLGHRCPLGDCGDRILSPEDHVPAITHTQER